MIPIEISEDIYSVGVSDWNIRDFHGYSTDRGTSYNAFLIIDEKITLVDTVKKEYAGQLLNNISKIIPPEKIDYVISNHTEMDHSGGLPEVMRRIGQEKPVYCSSMGKKNLSMHFRPNLNLQAVDNMGKLNTGQKTFTFLETRMVHWPDSMFTYLNEDRILFSSDGFGQHYAGPEIFDGEVGDEIMPYAKKYFANILLLFSKKIKKVLNSVAEIGLEIDMICPDHGVIWKEKPEKIISAYNRWCEQKPSKKAVIVYDTMWKSTALMAEKIAEGIGDMGVEVIPLNLRTNHRSDIITEILDARAVLVGSPTLNNNLYPTVSDFLTYMKGLKPQNKLAAAFGSYGWSGESIKQINNELEAMKFDIINPGLKIQYVPDREGLDTCIDFGKKIGEEIMK